ncbi:MAG: hypothetical protein KAJ19_10195 [Gammaproteobacteria bacterium]|nr:hypothetical protein [Gammaproteobacteria bacterium]
MAKSKAKTAKVRVSVLYDDKGHYVAAGRWTYGKRLNEAGLIEDATNVGVSDGLPHACIVDIELPIPKRLVGKVLTVKAVKPTESGKWVKVKFVRVKP